MSAKLSIVDARASSARRFAARLLCCIAARKPTSFVDLPVDRRFVY
jgi:hypothetical protein